MNLHLASHHGLCFGVRDALRATHQAAKAASVTVLGQLVHNPLVESHLQTLGVQRGDLNDLTTAKTHEVIITAHGASNQKRQSWTDSGFKITDTTCPLVRKAHDALATLVESGYFPVVIGQARHVEVQGLIGDFPQSVVILDEQDLHLVPPHRKLGVISQTTQPVARALQLVDALKRHHPGSEVRFVDTICHPTKQRQLALEKLASHCEVIVVIGGRNSNNTRQLSETAAQRGAVVFQIERAEELQQGWFHGVREVGITAGTSTLDETVRAVMDRLQQISAAHA
jgi:4-hydroxy-3-methylbut-2-en-1-yl diphosphate reductase